ncbi:MAG: type transport system permease protein [Frankiaceae bacterium]|jgi:hypothetical protein|nr:type transport system permease protein [Frankiaceae bacterium]
MSRLLAVELRRIASRRLVRLLVLGVFLVLTITNVVQAFNHTNDLGAARAKVTAQVQQQYDEQKAQGASLNFGFRCDEGFAGAIPSDPQTGQPVLPPECHALTVAELVDQQMQYTDPRFLMVRDGRNMLVAGMVVAALLAFLLSASAVGAEWNSGMFASLLTWEPRRPRVLLAKTAACVAFFTVVGALVIGYQVLSAAALAQTRGSFEGMKGPVTHELAGLVGRGVVLVALTAAAGAALAGIARSTAGAMAILGGYLVAVELGARNLLNGDTRWLLSTNTQALVGGRTTVYIPVEVPRAGGFRNVESHAVVISAGRAAIVIALIVAAVTLVHGLLLQRRDAN